MITFILYTLFVGTTSAMLTLYLRYRSFKNKIKNFETVEKEKASILLDWFKNDLMNTIETQEQSNTMIKAIDYLNNTLYTPNGLYNLSKYFSPSDKKEIVDKLMLLHKNFITFKEQSLLKLSVLVDIHSQNLQSDTKIALNTFAELEKRKVLTITEEFDKIIQVLAATNTRKENND